MTEKTEPDLVRAIVEALNESDERHSISVETTTAGPVSFVGIKRVPIGDYRWSKGESSILDWREKFQRENANDFPPFKPGEYVRVSGFVESDPGGPDIPQGLYRIRVDADGRIADNFFIWEVPEPDPLAASLGMPLEVIVEVLDERKADHRLSDIWNYDARLVDILSRPSVNPNNEDIQVLPTGTRVILAGTVVKYGQSGEEKFLEKFGYPPGSFISGHSSCGERVDVSITLPNGGKEKVTVTNPPTTYDSRDTWLLLKTKEGKTIKVELPTGKIRFSGGVLENLPVKSPELGDLVRLAPFVSRSKKSEETGETSKEGDLPEVRLAAHWCDPCYLDQPSPSRTARYNLLRTGVQEDLALIQEVIEHKEYARARKMIGNVRTLELTAAEFAAVRGLVGSLPESERPVQIPCDGDNQMGKPNRRVRTIDQIYQTRVEAMTPEEFIDFARSAVKGEINPREEHVELTYLFQLADYFSLDIKTRESLMVNCIEARLPRVRGKPYNHNTDFHDKDSVEQALKYLALLGTETSAESVFQYLKSFVEEGSYHKIGWRAHREAQPTDFLFAAVSAIEIGKRFSPPRILQRELPYLKKLSVDLQRDSDEPVTVAILERTIDYLEKRGNSN